MGSVVVLLAVGPSGSPDRQQNKTKLRQLNAEKCFGLGGLGALGLGFRVYRV